MAKADRYFSQYIRLRDSDHNSMAICITCGVQKHISEMDAGHFIDRSHNATRYDERNVNAQCRTCNRFQSGRQYEHGKAIDLKHGTGTAEQLLQDSRKITKTTQGEFEAKAEEFKQLAEEQRQYKRC